jgi:hypothetical protein
VDFLLNRLWDQYNLFHGEDGSSNFDEGIKSSTLFFQMLMMKTWRIKM